MVFFIPWPWLALLPAAVFLGVFVLSRRRAGGIAAAAWLLYAVYEYGIKARVLCSGECNIRVDLLLIHPALILGSIVALVRLYVTRTATPPSP